MKWRELVAKPDLISTDKERVEYLYCDCSAESPSRPPGPAAMIRQDWIQERNKPLGSAMAMAATWALNY